MRGFREIFVGLMVLTACAGCVQARSNTEKLEAAPLMIARGSNGVSMQWMAEMGTVYTLYYKDTVGADTAWKPVPGYERLQGKGELIEFKDNAPTAKSRRYRVHTVMPSTQGK